MDAADYVLTLVDGEARILDLDLGQRLGFAEPVAIRQIIRRYEEALAALGVVHTVKITPGAQGGRPGFAYYLNKRQAVFITTKSETERATEITIEVIQRFDDYETGRIAPPPQPTRRIAAPSPRATFRDYLAIAKMAGFKGNQATLAANRATVKMTGVDPLAIMDATHLTAETQEELLIATSIGERIGGLSAKAVNQRLLALGFHERDYGSKTLVWVPTEKGKPFGLWQDTSKRQGDGTPIRQWKWFASIIEHLQDEPRLALVEHDDHGGAA